MADMTEAQMAELLFGGTTQGADTKGQGHSGKDAPTSEQDRADRLYNGPEEYVSPFDKGQAQKTPQDAPEAHEDAPKTEGEPGGAEDRDSQDSQDGDSPEAYDAFEVPEGMELDQDALEAFQPVAKELGLDQDQAQKLVDVWNEQQEAQAEALEDASDAWREHSLSEFSDQDFDSAVSAIDRYGDEELRNILEYTRLGNHPAVIRFFAKIGGRGQAR